jgi:hypothetical protein
MKYLMIISLLSLSLTSFAQNYSFRVGTRVNIEKQFVGWVEEIVDSHHVEVSIDGKDFTVVRNLNALASRVQCFKGICAGDRVFFDGLWSAKVLEVFSNGQFYLKPDGAKYKMFRNYQSIKGVS